MSLRMTSCSIRKALRNFPRGVTLTECLRELSAGKIILSDGSDMSKSHMFNLQDY
ncbi:hypothetical protein VV208B2_45360 (plasmid) [Vibrio vulnificus]|nr:hypothetical protein VV208B2_45360 [Vibrio vulnificus]BDP38303.1 hypothetical protein VA208B3_46740 [Vibrio alginolyticus]